MLDERAASGGGGLLRSRGRLVHDLRGRATRGIVFTHLDHRL